MNTEKPSILIVDDVPVNIKVLKSILVDDYRVLVATDGLRAMDLVEANRPDLILLDIIMPKMDGYEVCRTLKEEPGTQDIPVIFISSKSEEEDETRGLALGAVDYIAKPFRPSVVHARVKTHLSMRGMQQKLIRQNAALIEADTLKRDVEHITRHDLKSPLNTVIGFADLLLHDETLALAQEPRDFIQMIRDAGFKALHMVNLSLDLYKMEQGTYQMKPKLVDLASLLEGIRRGDIAQKYGKNIPIHILIHDQPASEKVSFPVFGEELLCYSLFSNILKNALEASPKGQSVTISMTHDTMASIVIHNFGAVPLEIRERFFEKYVTSGKTTGTGLGTHSVKLMTEAQKGEIRMETSEAAGTSITVRLPSVLEDRGGLSV